MIWNLEGEGLPQVYLSINQNNKPKTKECMKQKVHYPLSQEPHKDIDPNDLTMNMNE